MNLKFKITASYFGSQEILTAAHMPLGTPFSFIHRVLMWASRRVEHDPARAAGKESAIRQHAERTTHDIHPRYGGILERNETSYKAEFFWSLYTQTLIRTVFIEKTLNNDTSPTESIHSVFFVRANKIGAQT